MARSGTTPLDPRVVPDVTSGFRASPSASGRACRWRGHGEGPPLMFASDDPVVLRVLELARRRVGLDVAWVSELAGGRQAYRGVEGDARRFGIVAGASTAVDGRICDSAGETLLTATVRAGVGVP